MKYKGVKKMEQVTMVIEGEPIAQPRHRVTARGKFGHAYIPKEHKVHEYKHRIKAAGAAHFKKPFVGPVKLLLQFVIPRPKSHWGKKGLLPSAPVFPSKRDFDNLAKAATDPLNGIAWIDDDQITTAHVVRRFSGVREDPGRTHITVTEDDYLSAAD